ncbi:MAG: hypothetical protein AAF682_17005 [Planctomycetota bacterium]
MKKLLAALAAALVLSVPTQRTALARVERLTLSEMMQRCDSAVHGEIVARNVRFVAEPDGPGLYFTTLTVAGYSLCDKVAITVDVTFPGGFLDAENGVFNSEAPSADDTAIGTRVVAFYKWIEDMGGGLAGNALYASHAGLFRTVEGPLGSVALGRGSDFAVSSNLRVASLASAVRSLEAAGR